MIRLYANVTGINQSDILDVSVTGSFGSSFSQGKISCINHSLNLGDLVTIDIGYEADHGQTLIGYVKAIDRDVPNNTYVISISDKMTRAVDFLIASTDPTVPYTFSNKLAEDIISDLMVMCGLTSVLTPSGTSYFTLATTEPAEVNLVTVYDYSSSIANILAWNLYSDQNGNIIFMNRKPYVMYGDSGQPGDTDGIGDTDIGVTITTGGDNKNIISVSHSTSEKDLRNKVLVYGSANIYAEASAVSPYLPTGFYKTIVAGLEALDSQDLAQDAANYNLQLYNRLTQSFQVSCLGNYRLFPYKVITLTDSYTGVNQLAFIYSCQHSWSKDGYVCQMELRL
jgi:hypothetical protein